MNDEIQTVAVIGAGQMGQGIAQTVAGAGCYVLLADRDEATAEKGRDGIAAVLQKLVSKGKLTASGSDAILERIRPVGEYRALSAAQLAVEAAVEHEPLKAEIFKKLDAVLPAGAVLASNTSSISITRIARGTKRPEQVIGMHFMNPVPVMKLVEVIRGIATADATYERVVRFAARLGKEVVTSQDYPGFIVNRILMPMINEAAFALMEGVASAADIDAAMQLGTHQPMGPLTLADFIGLDTCLSILEVMFHDLGDPKYRPCPLLRRLVESGRLGKKAGRGFHSYG
jgi:3-hydroxybutyryl-CoA dehydrogenase